MSSFEPLLVQYQVFAGRRLHFGRMFWQNIASMIVVLILAGFASSSYSLHFIAWVGVGLGVATLQMAYIAHRLRKMEDQYEQMMHDIEVTLKEAGHIGVLIAPRSGRLSARNMAVMSLALLGAAQIVLSAGVLLNAGFMR